MSLFHQISIETNLNPVFMTAMEMLDDENYLGADGRHLFVCQKNRYNDCTAIKLLLLHVQCMCEHSYITSIEWSMLYCVGQCIANKSAASVYILPTLHVWPRIELFYLIATCIHVCTMYTCVILLSFTVKQPLSRIFCTCYNHHVYTLEIMSTLFTTVLCSVSFLLCMCDMLL